MCSGDHIFGEGWVNLMHFVGCVLGDFQGDLGFWREPPPGDSWGGGGFTNMPAC